MASGVPDVKRTIITGLIGAVCVAVVLVFSKPMDHSYNVPHVDPEALAKWQDTMEDRMSTQERATEKLMARTDAMAQDLRDIKAGVNEINVYLRQHGP